MNSDSGNLPLIIALTQLTIWIVFWMQLRRVRTRAARVALRFGLMALGLAVVLNLALWLAQQSLENALLLALRNGLLVVMVVLVFALLIGMLIAVLSGALRPAADAPDAPE